MASLPASSSTPSLAVTQRPYQQPQSNTLSSSGPKPAQSGSASAPADPFFAPLERAAASIRDCLALDARWPDLADTFVGMYSYPLYRDSRANTPLDPFSASASADYELQLSAPWAPVEKRRSLIIPEAVFENYDCEFG